MPLQNNPSGIYKIAAGGSDRHHGEQATVADIIPLNGTNTFALRE
jgi:hypothetical protein